LRRQIAALLAFEGAGLCAAGALFGTFIGFVISLVLIRVVNRQSFHWSLAVHWPLGALAALIAAIVALCAIGARASGTFAVRGEALAAVKDDA
jgi:putative ABC transport system permease protein